MKYKIYCDGAASNNGYENAIGGWAFVMVDENDNIIAEDSGRVPGATNNRMELYSAYAGLTVNLFELGITELPEKVEVYSDSAYLHN